jgi:hypothetical protein
MIFFAGLVIGFIAGNGRSYAFDSSDAGRLNAGQADRGRAAWSGKKIENPWR